ncbi:MAG: helix-turn-helix transcriptional regulator [Rickettsiaceae bacterium]|nr:helix-turn-helix transcriptional regulator [Rickettsiaceae bacterium]
MSKSKVNNIDKLVSKKLRMRRVFLGLSQQDLATEINVSIQQVQKYEKAINRISSGRLYAMASFLKVPISYFFDQSNASIKEIENKLAKEEDAVKEDLEQVSEAEVIKLIKMYIAVNNDKVRKKITELIKEIADE